MATIYAVQVENGIENDEIRFDRRDAMIFAKGAEHHGQSRVLRQNADVDDANNSVLFELLLLSSISLTASFAFVDV